MAAGGGTRYLTVCCLRVPGNRQPDTQPLPRRGGGVCYCRVKVWCGLAKNPLPKAQKGLKYWGNCSVGSANPMEHTVTLLSLKCSNAEFTASPKRPVPQNVMFMRDCYKSLKNPVERLQVWSQSITCLDCPTQAVCIVRAQAKYIFYRILAITYDPLKVRPEVLRDCWKDLCHIVPQSMRVATQEAA